MAKTIVPDPGKVARGVTAKQIQKQAHNWLKFASADLDVVGDAYSAEYYLGMTDAYRDVLWFIEQQPVNRLAVGTGKKLFALLPAAIAVSYVINHRKDSDAQADGQLH